MKNLHDIIQKNMKEFEKTFPSIKDVAEKVGDTYGFPIYIQLKDFLLSSQLSIIQAIDEWAEKEIREYEKLSDMFKNIEVKKSANGARKSLSDLRSFLEKAKTKLQW